MLAADIYSKAVLKRDFPSKITIKYSDKIDKEKCWKNRRQQQHQASPKKSGYKQPLGNFSNWNVAGLGAGDFPGHNKIDTWTWTDGRISRC